MIAAIKCNRRTNITNCPDHALRLAEDRAEISGRRYGVFSAGLGLYRVRRIAGNPSSALEIITPSWSYDEEYRAKRGGV